MNNLYRQMNTKNLLSNLSKDKIKQAMTMMRSTQNPQAMLNQAMQNNPQAKELMALLQSGNKSPEDYRNLFYQTAERMGIDPNSVIDLMR